MYARWRAFHADCGTQIALAHALLGVPALFLALDAALRWVRLPLPLGVQAALAVGLYAALAWRWPVGRPSRQGVAVTAALVAVWWLLSALLYDTSWDGTSYHLPGLLAVAQGWNPVWGHSGIGAVDVQATGLATLRAALYAVTDSAEGAKTWNFVFALAALFTLIPAWTEWRGRPLTALELGLCYAAAGNPVALGQLFTFYVDGTVYAAGLALLGATLLTGSAHRRAALGLVAAAIVLLTGAKLTGLFYGAALPALAWFAARRRIAQPLNVAAVAVAALALGTVAIGFRPYVTNPRDYGHLVELGELGNVVRPYNFRDLSPPGMLARALLSRTDTTPFAIRKWPMSVSLHELVSMGAPDPHLGGLGPLFALETIAAALAAAMVLARRRGRGLGDAGFVVALGAAAITTVFPEPWSARYAPFFWLVPIFAVLGAGERHRPERWAAVLVLALALWNGGLAFAGNAARTVRGDYRLRTFLAELKAQHAPILIVPIPFLGFEITAAHRFDAAGIPYRIGEFEPPGATRSSQCATVLRAERILYCLPATAAPPSPPAP